MLMLRVSLRRHRFPNLEVYYLHDLWGLVVVGNLPPNMLHNLPNP